MTTILAVLAILQGFLTLIDGIRAARYMRTLRPPRQIRRESVIVYCPCKGIDPEFEENVLSIVGQDYPNYEVAFIVESADDAAYAKLRELDQKVLIAGPTTDQGQKVHNLSYGVQHAGAACDIYVFCDSDARFPTDWLSQLVAPLDATNITTGYRWYVADRFRFSVLMRSAWNASTVGILGNHARNFAWGGSTAMYRETFDRLKIFDAWRGSVSDDYAITRTAQRAGAKIIFIPGCLIPTYGTCTLRELFEFTTRQIIITRVYHPGLWRVGFFGHAVFNAAFLILPLSHPLLWFTIYGLSGAKSWIRYSAVKTVLPPSALSNYGWFYILFSPLVALLYLYNMAASALTTEIVWRQIHYKLISPNETQVFGPSTSKT